MTMKHAACVIAVSLVAGPAWLPAPASARDVRISTTHGQANKMLRAAAIRGFNAGYAAGLRRNISAAALRSAYNRGYSEAMNRLAYNPSRAATVYARPIGYGSNGLDSYARYDGPIPNSTRSSSYPRYSGNYRDAYAAGYAGDVNAGRSATYVRYSGNYYGDANGYMQARYDTGFNPIGDLLNVVFAPFVAASHAASHAATQNDRWAYCSQRYRSFEPATGTFLAYDGNRYYCG